MGFFTIEEIITYLLVLAYIVFTTVSITIGIIKKDTRLFETNLKKAILAIVLCCIGICFTYDCLSFLYDIENFSQRNNAIANAKLVYTISDKYLKKVSENNIELTDCAFSGNINRRASEEDIKYDGTNEDFNTNLYYNMGNDNNYNNYYWVKLSAGKIETAQWSSGSEFFGQYPNPVPNNNDTEVIRYVHLTKTKSLKDEYKTYVAIITVFFVFGCLLAVCILISVIQYRKLKVIEKKLLQENPEIKPDE